MQGFGPSTYGDGFADVYDQWYGQITDATATASFMAARTKPGPVLELGVGSGRLAGPLREADLTVVGVDASSAMLAICREQQPLVPVVQADLAHLPVAGPLGGAVCAFNTLFNLPSVESQQALLSQVATALSPGAPLVIEAMTGFALADGPKTSVGVSTMATDRLVLSATVLDHDAQTIQGQHVDITEQHGIVLRPWFLRWTLPDELDRIANEVGLDLNERFSGWNNEPFDAGSETHISVYRRLS